MQKKKHPKFVVPGYGTRNRSRVPHRWRKQRGTDNKKRVALSGYGATPHIGYKNSDTIRFLRSDGSKQVLVHNEKELMDATKGDVTKVVVVIAHDISRRKRIAMQSIADKHKLRIANKVKEQPKKVPKPEVKAVAPKVEKPEVAPAPEAKK
ncbi:MAG: eL32 family ribosomal protein [Candidatus Micrarchaeales archaeon]